MSNSWISFILKLGFVFIIAVVIFHVSIALSRVIPGDLFRAEHIFFGLLCSSLIISLILLAHKYVDRESYPRVYLNGDLKALVLGIFLFIIPTGIALIVAVASGLVGISILEPNGGLLLGTGSVLLLVLLSEALPEELLFRGYFYGRIAEMVKNKWVVIFAQSVLFFVFAFLIGAIDSLLDASFLLTFAAILGMCRALFKSVWAPIGFHLACMTTQQSLGPGWNIFLVENGAVLQTYVLGMLPLTVAAAFLCIILLNKKHD